MSRAVITSIGGFVPDDILSNQDLEKMVDTTDEWITSRTGIKERRILKGEGKATSYMGVQIVNEILQKRGISPDEIDMLICATVTGDMIFPDTANTILDKVGAKNAFGYDINAACSGFLFALTTATKFIESGTFKKVIVLGIDMMSSIINYTDRTTCIIFGDGGGGVLLEPSEDERYGIIDSILKADGSGRAYLHMKAGGSLKPPSMDSVLANEHYVYQDGKPVFKAAVTGMVSTIKELLVRNNLDMEEIDWLVPHQANMRIINSVAEMLDFPKEKVMINIHKYGNTTAATIPLATQDAIQEGKLQKGDLVLFAAVGAGFTVGANLWRWGY